MAGDPKPWVMEEKWDRCLWIPGSSIGGGLVLHSGDLSWFSSSISSWHTYLEISLVINVDSHMQRYKLVFYSNNFLDFSLDYWSYSLDVTCLTERKFKSSPLGYKCLLTIDFNLFHSIPSKGNKFKIKLKAGGRLIVLTL